MGVPSKTDFTKVMKADRKRRDASVNKKSAPPKNMSPSTSFMNDLQSALDTNLAGHGLEARRDNKKEITIVKKKKKK